MKFEMEFGWNIDEKITVETDDFDKIKVIQEFIEFQESFGWAVEYEAVDYDEEEDTEEEEVVVAGLTSDEE